MKKFVVKITIAAFAIIGITSCSQPRYAVRTRPEPPPVVRVHSNPPSPRHVWVNGDYVRRNGRYVWSEGYWYIPKQGYHRTDGYWKDTRRGWVWVPGYWR